MRSVHTVHATRGRNGGLEPKTELLAVASLRGGSGKSLVTANLAFLAARGGAKVAALDADLQAPMLHRLFGIAPASVLHTLSEFLKGRCEIDEVPIDLARQLGIENRDGGLHCVPASTELETMTSLLFEGYDAARLDEGLRALAEQLELDCLLLDTHLGFNRETLLSLAICDTVIVLLRPDGLDRAGARGLIEIATKLGIPSLLLVPNMVPAERDAEEVAAQVEEDLGAPVAGVLPWCEELREPGDRLFAASHPDHPFTQALEKIRLQALPARGQEGAAHDLDREDGRLPRGPEGSSTLRGGDEVRSG